MKIFLLTLLSFATLARADDAQEAIKAIETQNHVKFIAEAPSVEAIEPNGFLRLQIQRTAFVFAYT